MDELHIIYALVTEMTGIIVESKGGAVVKSTERAVGTGNIEGNLGGMDLQGETYAHLVEDIQYGIPTPGKIVVTRIDHARRIGRKRIQQVPDAYCP